MQENKYPKKKCAANLPKNLGHKACDDAFFVQIAAHFLIIMIFYNIFFQFFYINQK